MDMIASREVKQKFPGGRAGVCASFYSTSINQDILSFILYTTKSPVTPSLHARVPCNAERMSNERVDDRIVIDVVASRGRTVAISIAVALVATQLSSLGVILGAAQDDSAVPT